MSSRLEQKISELRLRAERLQNDEAICLQLEASLVHLARERDAALRSVEVSEQKATDRRNEIDRKTESIASIVLKFQDQLRSVRENHDAECRKFEDGILMIVGEEEDEENSLNYETSRLKRQSSELSDHEAMLREKLRVIFDEEAALTLRARKVATRERGLADVARVTLMRLEEELKQREALLHE